MRRKNIPRPKTIDRGVMDFSMALSVLILVLSGSTYYIALEPLREEMMRLKVNEELSNLFQTIQTQPEAVMENARKQCDAERSAPLPFLPGSFCNERSGLYAAILSEDGEPLYLSPSWADDSDALLHGQLLEDVWRYDVPREFGLAIPGILDKIVRVWIGTK